MSKKKLFNFLRNQNLDNLVKPITKTFNQNNNEIKTEYPSLHYPVMYEKVNQIIKENMLKLWFQECIMSIHVQMSYNQ